MSGQEPDQKPTPETDALALEMNVQGLREWTLMNHARRLERERDEAHDALVEAVNKLRFSHFANQTGLYAKWSKIVGGAFNDQTGMIEFSKSESK